MKSADNLSFGVGNSGYGCYSFKIVIIDKEFKTRVSKGRKLSKLAL